VVLYLPKSTEKPFHFGHLRTVAQFLLISLKIDRCQRSHFAHNFARKKARNFARKIVRKAIQKNEKKNFLKDAQKHDQST